MTQREALMAAVLADPDDDLVRLVFADHLEENAGVEECPECGDGEAYYNTPGRERDAPCDRCRGRGVVPDADADWAEFIRVGCEVEGHCRQCEGTRVLLGTAGDRHNPPCPRCRPLLDREAVLFLRRSDRWFGMPSYLKGPTGRSESPCLAIRRGFPEAVLCTMGWWVGGRGPELVGRWPITTVKIGDRDPYCTIPDREWVWTWEDVPADPAHTRHSLPRAISELVRVVDRIEVLAYPTRAAAMESLSRACLAWAKGEK